MNFTKSLSKLLLLSSLIFSVLGCGKKVTKPEIVNDPRPEAPTAHQVVSTTIGTGGGELKDGDNLKIKVPAGALNSNKNISAQYIEDQVFLSDKISYGFLGAVEFGPSGTTFDKPVDISLKLSDKPVNDKLSVFCYDELSNRWDFISEASYTNNIVSFSVDHFSKYEVLDISPAMLDKALDLIWEAILNNKPDTWIRDTYKDYLINEKHVFDYYTTQDGYYYEPCGLFVYINYDINGREGNQEDTYIGVGEDNHFGEFNCVSRVGNMYTSYQEYLKNKEVEFEKNESYNVLIVVEYKMIVPQIELSATEQALKKGESATVSVYTHYAKPSNKLFPDIVLDNYPLSLPRPLEHLYTNKEELTTDGSGRASFVATSKDGEAETIEVNFTVGGYFGTTVSNYISFAKKKNNIYNMNGHVSCEGSFVYWLMDEDASDEYQSNEIGYEKITVDENTPGTVTVKVDYDFNGSITWTDDYSYEGVISYSGVVVSISDTGAASQATMSYEYHLHDPLTGDPYTDSGSDTVRREYNLNRGGNAVINPINQLGFSGMDVFGLAYSSFDENISLPTFIKYFGNGYASARKYGYTASTINNTRYEHDQSGSSSFNTEWYFFTGGPLVSGFVEKAGTQTITKENYMKVSPLLIDPTSPDGYIDETSQKKSTTMTITLVKKK